MTSGCKNTPCPNANVSQSRFLIDFCPRPSNCPSRQLPQVEYTLERQCRPQDAIHVSGFIGHLAQRSHRHTRAKGPQDKGINTRHGTEERPTKQQPGTLFSCFVLRWHCLNDEWGPAFWLCSGAFSDPSTLPIGVSTILTNKKVRLLSPLIYPSSIHSYTNKVSLSSLLLRTTK